MRGKNLIPRKTLSRRLGMALLLMGVSLVLNPIFAARAWGGVDYKSIHRFTGRGGSFPGGNLILDKAGNLYGTTYDGGTYDDGTIFELTPSGNSRWRVTILHSFNYTDGEAPGPGVIFDSAGNLYGATSLGGIYDNGTVFKLTPNGHGGWKESVLHSFNGSDGSGPDSGVILSSAGNLYGTTFSGGAYNHGTVFKLTLNGDGTWKESVLHSFNSLDGGNPFAGLIFDSAGNLYGTTEKGGTHVYYGTVFNLTLNGDGTWKESVLHSFNGLDGGNPFAGLIFDSAGNLYGTTLGGGAYEEGEVFELTPNGHGGWNESVLHSFIFDGEDGVWPAGGLIFGPDGGLYGTTMLGGAYDYGTVFKLKPRAKGVWTESVTHSFKNLPGAGPQSGLIFDGHGSLYGTTAGDGETTSGSVFVISP